MDPKRLLTAKEKKALIEGIWTGKYDPAQIPEWLFVKLATGYEAAAVAGWGVALGEGPIVDQALELSFKENLYYFAASKEAHELKEMQQMLIGSKSKYDFVEKAVKLDETWNYHWYNTEANVTERLAQSGREWQRIQEFKDIYPKLQFVAVMDPNTRDDHAALNGTIAGVDDPFWETYFPPLDWNCRCTAERLEDGEDTNMEGKNLPDVDDQFSTRVTDSKEIWSSKHPYFERISNESDASIRKIVTDFMKA